MRAPAVLTTKIEEVDHEGDYLLTPLWKTPCAAMSKADVRREIHRTLLSRSQMGLILTVQGGSAQGKPQGN
jgi:hypothetical protein